MKAQCDACGSFGSAYVPKGGDGSLWVMRPHNCNGFSRRKRMVANLNSQAERLETPPDPSASVEVDDQ